MPGVMNRGMISTRASLLAGALAAGIGGGWAGLTPLRAQEVVQALPPQEAAQLNAALRRLAARPTDLDALLSAGNASLALHDAGAAAGFFARAANVAPSDARVLLGLARVALEQRRPVDALQGFERAERAGVRPLDMAADRALAYDLVGDNAAAQALYRTLLTSEDTPEVRRRLALSLAISGNRSEFERVLYPLLRDEDRAAFRTRAFGLAILGRPDDAVAIADTMMPTDLALRMAPYLRYMPRLTKAQQAAAGNLGAFPAAAEIGRDSADIAGYASAGARIAANANTALTPAGTPLGRRSQPAASDRGASRRDTTPGPALASTARVAQAPRPRAQAPAPTPTPTPAPASAPAPEKVAVAIGPQAPALQPAPEPEADRPSLAEAFADLGPAAATAGPPAPGAVDVAELAAARELAEARAAKEAEAKAKAAREAEAKAAKAKAEKAAKAAEPARHWVQIGVGRNVSAFGFDWRKLARQAGGALDGKGPWAGKYGATNRMLAGPYPNEAAAKAAIKRLKDKGIEALPFTSDEGEKVTKVG